MIEIERSSECSQEYSYYSTFFPPFNVWTEVQWDGWLGKHTPGSIQVHLCLWLKMKTKFHSSSSKCLLPTRSVICMFVQVRAIACHSTAANATARKPLSDWHRYRARHTKGTGVFTHAHTLEVHSPLVPERTTGQWKEEEFKVTFS